MVVDISIRWHDIENVAILGLLATAPPTLGYRVLTVDAIANGAVTAALVAVGVLVIGAVHIDVIAPGIGVGVIIGFPQAVIPDVGVRGDDLIKSSEQSLITLVQSIGIVPVRAWSGVLGTCGQYYRHKRNG